MFELHDIKNWVDLGAARYVDFALVKWLASEDPQMNAEVIPLLLATSYSASLGQVCIDLDDWLLAPSRQLNFADESNEELLNRAQKLDSWATTLSKETFVNALKTLDAVASGTVSNIAKQTTPFVLIEERGKHLLYLRRYWQSEQIIVNGITERLDRATSVSETDIRDLLTALFGQASLVDDTDWQRVACGIAASNHFSIITGGPGTGKTTTVLRLLALLQGQHLMHGLSPLAIRLAAPTGKAAARLNESIAANLARLDLPEIGDVQPDTLKAIIPTQVTTLHRLLKPKPNSRQFAHNKSNPLVADIVVVDEASMIDIEMMASLFEGIEADTRVILLGDKDQLASVEAGYVLGDLCRGATQGNYTSHTVNWVAEICGETIDPQYINESGTKLNQAVCMLRRSYRFVEGGVIHQLATLVNEDSKNEQAEPKLPRLHEIFALSQKREPNNPALRYIEQKPEFQTELSPAVRTLLSAGYGGFLAEVSTMPTANAGLEAFDQWGKRVLEKHVDFQLLVATRQGEWGVEAMNQKIEQLLVASGKLPSVSGLWYLGRPVMVTQNDYSVDLMNGDVGVSLLYPIDGVLKQRVIFSDGKGGVRWVLPSRLQSVETVFAMTVHKSQGSEFTHTAMLLPNKSSNLLTKELIYTGITRSKKYFTLVSGDDRVLEEAMNRKVERASGLALYIR